MTREEAIKYLEQHAFIDDVVKDMCIEALQKLDNNLSKDSKWIPCKVDMPKENKTYLTTVYDKATGRRMLKHRECRNGSFKEGGSSRAFPVIAWMSLPEPYKEGES